MKWKNYVKRLPCNLGEDILTYIFCCNSELNSQDEWEGTWELTLCTIPQYYLKDSGWRLNSDAGLGMSFYGPTRKSVETQAKEFLDWWFDTEEE